MLKINNTNNVPVQHLSNALKYMTTSMAKDNIYDAQYILN